PASRSSRRSAKEAPCSSAARSRASGRDRTTGGVRADETASDPPKPTMIRILLAEDHETVREGLRLLVNAQPDMRVVAEVGDGRAAVDAVAALQPDVVVLDLSMPSMGGLSAARAMKSAGTSAAIVALTRHDDDAYVHELLAAGASGYVLKQSASAELLRAIRIAAEGGRYLDPALPP